MAVLSFKEIKQEFVNVYYELNKLARSDPQMQKKFNQAIADFNQAIETGDSQLIKKLGEEALLLIAKIPADQETTSRILKSGIDLNCRDEDRNTAMSLALESGNFSLLPQLIMAGTDPDSCDKDGIPIIFEVIKSAVLWSDEHQECIINTFFDSGPDLNVFDDNGDTVLTRSLKDFFLPLEIIQRIIADSDVNLCSKDGQSPLQIALEKNKSPVIISRLINSGAIISFGMSAAKPLIEVIDSIDEYFEVIPLYIKAGSDVNSSNKTGYTPLLKIIESGLFEKMPELISMLLDAGADVNARNRYGETALHLLLKEWPKRNSSEILHRLIDAGADVNAFNERGFSILMYAASTNDLQTISRLVSAGADINFCNEKDQAVLFHVADERDITLKTLTALIEMGADIKACNNKGCPASLLLMFKHIDNTKAISMLIDAGADVNSSAPWGENALMRAVRHNHLESIKLLIKHKADLKGKNYYNETVATITAQKCNDARIITILSDAGADFSLTDKLQRTNLMIAASTNKNPDIIIKLIEIGSDIHARCKKGWTALMYAAYYNENPEIIKVLADAGAELNARVKIRSGETPLMIAAKNTRSPEIIAALLKAGADPSIRLINRKSALDFASANPFLADSDVIQKLR